MSFLVHSMADANLDTVEKDLKEKLSKLLFERSVERDVVGTLSEPCIQNIQRLQTKHVRTKIG